MSRQSWFHQLFGFEESPARVRDQLELLDGNVLRSKANGARFRAGTFATPTLHELRFDGQRALEQHKGALPAPFSFEHVVQTDVLVEHARCPGALFQAASQFNCLEFPTPRTLPEHGVTAYAFDRTQGPACALACAAGTVVRNYFVDVAAHCGERLLDDEDDGDVKGAAAEAAPPRGQRRGAQINLLDAVELVLNNRAEKYFQIRNGYTFAGAGGEDGAAALARLSAVLAGTKQQPRPPAHLPSYDDLLGLTKIGLQTDVGVTFRGRFDPVRDDVVVTQAYCSAVSCRYSNLAAEHWTELAQLALDAAYEATLWAGVCNALRDDDDAAAPRRPHRGDVYLTFLGGGAFGNDPAWIAGAIGRALARMHAHHAPIRVRIAHHGRIDADLVERVQRAFDTAAARSVANA